MTHEEEKKLNEMMRWHYAQKFHSSTGNPDVIRAAGAYVTAIKDMQNKNETNRQIHSH